MEAPRTQDIRQIEPARVQSHSNMRRLLARLSALARSFFCWATKETMDGDLKARLSRWMAWADRTIGRVVAMEGLHAELQSVEVGPMTVAFVVRLRRPTRKDIQALLSLDKALGQALQMSSVTIQDTQRGIEIILPSPMVQTPQAGALIRASKGLQIAIGVDRLWRPVHVNLGAPGSSHLLLIGPSGHGKSEALRTTLHALAHCNPPQRVQFLILAKKVKTWRAFEPAVHNLGLVLEPKEQEQALQWLRKVMEKRARAGKYGREIFCLVDDLHNLAKGANIVGHLGEIASLGRECGIHLLLSTQTSGKAGGLSQELEQNITTRLLFGAGDASAGARYAGSGGLQVEKVGLHPGDCLLLLDGTPHRIATGLDSDTSILASLPAGNSQRPWAQTPRGRTGPDGTEQARAGIEQAEQAEQAGTGSPPPSRNGNDSGRRPDGGRAWPEQAGEQAPEQGIENRLDLLILPAEALARMSNEELQARSLRLDTSRAPTLAEAIHIRELHRQLGSIKRTVLASYGFYNGKTRDLALRALEKEADGTVSQQDSKPVSRQADGVQAGINLGDSIDLRTEEGRDILASLQKAGLIQWPEPKYQGI